MELESQIKSILHSYKAIFYSPLHINSFIYPSDEVHFSRYRGNCRLPHRELPVNILPIYYGES